MPPSTMSVTYATASAAAADNSSTDRKIQLNSAASSSVCPLCYEEDLSASPTSAVVFSACRHRSCRTCLIKWMEREEASGRTAPPPCPFCRATINEEDVFAILGRPFRSRRAAPGDPGDGDQISDLTLQWINEHTVPCGGCGSRIEKAGGCDLLECLCGYRFCYGCGVAGGECDCNPTHVFDNDMYALNDSYIPDGPVRDGDGRVDLGSCIRRRGLRRERELEREWKWQEESERWEHSERNASICTSNGRWLFVPAKDAGCVSMLANQLGHERIGDEREFERYLREWEDYGRWNYVLDHRRRSFSSILRRDREDVPTFSLFWLYLPQGEDVAALRQHSLGRRYKKKRKLAKFFRGMYDAVRKRTNRE